MQEHRSHLTGGGVGVPPLTVILFQEIQHVLCAEEKGEEEEAKEEKEEEGKEEGKKGRRSDGGRKERRYSNT